MAMCEDFPCCGHEMGCCPRFDDAGRQLDMVCTCGARLPVTNRFSICDGCIQRGMDDDHEVEFADEDEDEDEDYYEDCGMEDEWLDSYMEDRMGGGEDF